jgi:hypothetical protein
MVTSIKLPNICFESHHVSCKEHCFQIKIKIAHGAAFGYFLASCIALWPPSFLDCDPNMLLSIMPIYFLACVKLIRIILDVY